MKKVRKLICLALAMVMALAMCATVYADGETCTITVQNASKGEYYKLVKVFDAVYNTKESAIVYYELKEGVTAIPPELSSCFELKQQGGKNYVVKREGVADNDIVGAVAAWAKNQTGIVKQAEGGELVFEGLEYGYYAVVSRSDKDGNSDNGSVVSVTNLNPTAEIYDKSTSDTPDFPSNGTGKVADYETYTVGDTVTYTITYNTVNWMNADNDETNGAETKIYQYVVKDTLPGFLSNVSVTEVKVGDTLIDNLDYSGFNNKNGNGTFIIPWTIDGTAKGDSLYPNNVVLTIKYTATINNNILNAGDNNHKNEITITPNGDSTLGEDKASEDVYTCSIVISKYAADSNGEADTSRTLAGAKFKLCDAETGGQYAHIDNAGKVTWGAKDDAYEVTTDNDGKATFPGLKIGTYYLEETEAPAGYNKLESRVKVEIEKKDGTLASNGALSANITKDAKVVNGIGTQLPSTGGIGTTIFYVVGSILMLGAVVLFVTRKRSTER